MIVQSVRQSVYFLRRAELGRADVSSDQGRCVMAVVLVDAALEHRYENVLELVVVDGPNGEAIAACSIDPREMSLYPDARYAVIVSDHRASQRTLLNV